MVEDCPNEERGPIASVVHRLGELAGKSRPDWFSEEVWDQSTPGQRRMIRTMHDRGGAGFRILRSAETVPKNYTRSESDAE